MRIILCIINKFHLRTWFTLQWFWSFSTWTSWLLWSACLRLWRLWFHNFRRRNLSFCLNSSALKHLLPYLYGNFTTAQIFWYMFSDQCDSYKIHKNFSTLYVILKWIMNIYPWIVGYMVLYCILSSFSN